MERQKTGCVKSRSVLVLMNLVGFPSIRPKMIGCIDGKIRPPDLGRYEGRWIFIGNFSMNEIFRSKFNLIHFTLINYDFLAYKKV